MRALITGATGLVGNNCLRLLNGGESQNQLHVLVRKGHSERPLATLSGDDSKSPFDDNRIVRHYVDLTRPNEIDSLPEFDVFIHAAADTHIGRQPRPIQHTINVVSTAKLAKLARQQQSRFVFVSSVDALPAGSPDQWVNEETKSEAKFPCGYVRTKREAEQIVLDEIDSGLDGYIVNPGFMLGPWDWKPSSGRMLLEVANKFTPFGPKGGFSVCDVVEVAKAICKIAQRGAAQHRYILAGNNMRYIEAWRVFADVSGGSKPICPAGPLMRFTAGRWGDMMGRITGTEGDINSAAIGMSNLYHYYDSSRAKNELDYRIPPARESVRAAWDWFGEYGYR